ncbi:group II intron maturase-specific domain-containing protein [Streptomyces sp. NPDC006333]|uniref:group II intron maturase-specific domain-containing protein n=1 Tax=Streptomyces sp. NPDC006333 TaxID=3156753 RepID=UPI0033B230F5
MSSSAFRALDYHMWHLTYSWAQHEHRKKSKHWIVHRYYGKFHPTSRTAGCSAIGNPVPISNGSPGLQ